MPAVAQLAARLGASVTLVHIIERDAPQAVHGGRHLTQAPEAEAYLAEIARRYLPPDVAVETHVHPTGESKLARSIVQHVDELNSDLIVLAMHGSSGFTRWLSGSVGQNVIGLGGTSVMLIPQTEGGAAELTCRKFLIALDGDPAHEESLGVAAELAGSAGAALHLLVVVPTLDTLSGSRAATGRMLPRATTELLDLKQQAAADYLRDRAGRLLAQNLAVTAEVNRGDPARIILEAARRAGADLIVLGTHGKTGMESFLSGSITPKVVSQARTPLLLVRLHGEHPAV